MPPSLSAPSLRGASLDSQMNSKSREPPAWIMCTDAQFVVVGVHAQAGLLVVLDQRVGR